MLVKYKTAAIIMVIVMAFATTSLAAPARINKLELSRDEGFTVLTIHGDNQLKFAKESIPASEGKPFRIVIDCLAAQHSLSQKDFEELPPSIIRTIRTSQYAVSPEEVVRVVMDLNEESVYRVESVENDIKVYVSDEKSTPFETWSSQPSTSTKPVPIARRPSIAGPKLKTAPAPSTEKPATTVAKTAPTPSTEKPATTVATTAQPQPAVPSAAKKPSVVKRNVYQANKSANLSPYVAKLPPPSQDQEFVPTLPDAPESSTQPVRQPSTVAATTENAESGTKVPAQKKLTQPSVTAQPEIKKDLTGDTIVRAKAFASLDSETGQTPEPGMNTAQSETESKDVHKPGTSPSTPSAASSVKKDSKPVLASLDDETEQEPAAPELEGDEDSADKIKTSKYRRESAKSAELKAAQVVQFPQRMVIKYRQGNARDPFESLITLDKRKKGNVDLNRVPNVETLNLVGILQPFLGKGAALMEDMDGIGYILRPGDRVRNGYVAQIDNQAIYFQINEYGWGRTVVKQMEKEN